MNISVALASYNGGKYIEEQIRSILDDIDATDEIIISDDGSMDDTLSIISAYAKHDPRIRLVQGSQKGLIKNFENAILECKNDIIFLSDQDDIWVKGKRDRVLQIFEENSWCNLVSHNGTSVDENLKSNNKRILKNMKHGIIYNILLSSYFGCCMAFKKSACKEFLPFPDGIVAHDQWIGLVEEKMKKSIFLEDEELVLHREHGLNMTKKLPLWRKITFRWNLLWNLMIYRSDKS